MIIAGKPQRNDQRKVAQVTYPWLVRGSEYPGTPRELCIAQLLRYSLTPFLVGGLTQPLVGNNNHGWIQQQLAAPRSHNSTQPPTLWTRQ